MRCNLDVSMGAGGAKGLNRHEETALHSRVEKSTVGALPLNSYFGPVRHEVDNYQGGSQVWLFSW